MGFKLTLKRKTKALFLKYKLHVLTEPFTGALLNLAYLSKFSAWAANNRNPGYNDFYQTNWDFQRRYNLYEHVLKSQNLAGESINYLEFGVDKGASFKWWLARNTNAASRFYGFDTFTGLPEAWDHMKKGHFNNDGKFPDVNGDTRAKFLPGLFQQRLPEFLKTFDKTPRKLIHLDADLYSSTLYVLTTLHPYLNDGDIVMFDEYGVPTHEFLAFDNYKSSFYTEFELLGAANNYFFAAFKVKK